MNWSYVAGFFDGEGSLSEIKHGNGRIPGVQMTQKERLVLDEIARFLADEGVPTHIYFNKNKWGGAYNLRIGRPKDSLSFIRAVFPYLVVKKAEAERVVHRLEDWNTNHKSYDI